MRITIILLLILFLIQPVLAQTPSKTQKTVKNEMQDGVVKAVNELNKQIADLEKQIEDAKKNKEDESTIRDLENQVSMLKKQVQMMRGVNKSLSEITEKTFEEAGEEEPVVPKKDISRISMLPKKILSQAELSLFVKNVHGEVEKIISAEEKKEAVEIYTETKTKFKSVVVLGNVASGCWMLSHWEKALFIMGKACMDDISNTDNLSNYASFLIMTGAEQAALPILQYLDLVYPKNSTIQNNIGQAWFGLGEMNNAKKFLESATRLYPNHSTANATLSKIYLQEGDANNAITSLKSSIKETYDPYKEADLLKLGVKLKFADLPDFDYPMKKDPYNIEALINSWPTRYQTSINEKEPAYAVQRYLNGIRNLTSKITEENVELDKKIRDNELRLSSDIEYRNTFLDPYNNSPAYKLALSSLNHLYLEKPGGAMQINLLLPIPVVLTELEKITTPDELYNDCIVLYEDSVEKPIAALVDALNNNKTAYTNCQQVDAAYEAFLQKRAAIETNGVELIKQWYIKQSEKFGDYIKRQIYSTLDPPPSIDLLTTDLINHTKYTRTRFKNVIYDGFLRLTGKIIKDFDVAMSNCKNEQFRAETGQDDLIPLLPSELKCEFIKKLNTEIVEYSFECNWVIIKTKKNLKDKKSPNPRGKGINGKNGNQSQPSAPLTKGRGPHFFPDENEFENVNQKLAPLNSEDKDPSQFSIEYDRWGNLVGFKCELNKERTGLADPDSIESGVESRWSWNAIASPKKGFLNKLVIK